MSLDSDLALWRARWRYRDTQLTAAQKKKDTTAIRKWGFLLEEASLAVYELEREANPPPHLLPSPSLLPDPSLKPS